MANHQCSMLPHACYPGRAQCTAREPAIALAVGCVMGAISAGSAAHGDMVWLTDGDQLHKVVCFWLVWGSCCRKFFGGS